MQEIYGEGQPSPMLRFKGEVTPRKRERAEGWREAISCAVFAALLAAACAWVTP